MKLARTLLTTLACGVLATAPGCRRSPEEPEASTVPAAATPAAVRATTVVVATLRPSIDLIGTVAAIPERTHQVSTQTAGQVMHVAIVEGQPVHSGDLLVQLDNRLVRTRLASARAAEQRAQAVLDKLEHGPRREEVEAARQTARQLAAVARSLKAKFEALRSLHENGEASSVEFEQARARVEAADAESSAAEARVRLLEAGTRPEEIAEARADLAEARAAVAAVELAVEFGTVKSPIDGVVTMLSVRNGAYVTPGDLLAEVVDTSELFVRVRVPSSQRTAVVCGESADVWSGDDDAAVRGTVTRISPRADADSGAVEAFVTVANADGVLRPGLACRVRIWLAELPDALIIPVAAVADRNGSSVVTVIRENRAHEQVVRLGVTTSTHAQVLDGLVSGELVAVEGGYGLPDGCPVKITTDVPGTGGQSK